jgi:hypothetical protein
MRFYAILTPLGSVVASVEVAELARRAMPEVTELAAGL